MFHIGQKVVCVDDSPGDYSAKTYLVLNAVYTIRGFCENIHGDIGLLLVELRPSLPRLLTGQERGFYQRRFRPIVERKTDISIFTEMLKPIKVEA